MRVWLSGLQTKCIWCWKDGLATWAYCGAGNQVNISSPARQGVASSRWHKSTWWRDKSVRGRPMSGVMALKVLYLVASSIYKLTLRAFPDALRRLPRMGHGWGACGICFDGGRSLLLVVNVAWWALKLILESGSGYNKKRVNYEHKSVTEWFMMITNKVIVEILLSEGYVGSGH